VFVASKCLTLDRVAFNVMILVKPVMAIILIIVSDVIALNIESYQGVPVYVKMDTMNLILSV